MPIHVIQTENIVANYFEQHPEANQLKLSKIQAIGKQLKSNFKNQDMSMSIVINFTTASIINMLNRSPDIFELKGSTIMMKDREKFNEKMSWYFDSKIDDTVKDTYLQLMKTLA